MKLALLGLLACGAPREDGGDVLDEDSGGSDTASESLATYDSLVAGAAAPYGYLQFGNDFQVGDVNGDGADDVFVGSQEANSDFVGSGEAWLFDGRSREPLAYWEGSSGNQELGQAVAIARGSQGNPVQLIMRSLEGFWVVASGAPSGYPGDVGGFLIGQSSDHDYLPGNRVAAVDVVGDAAEDVVAECGLDDGSVWHAAVCITRGPVSGEAFLGQADAIVDGESLGTAFAGPDVDADGAATSWSAPTSRRGARGVST